MAVKRIKRTRSGAPVGRVRRTRQREMPGSKPRYFVRDDLTWGQKFQLYLMTSYLYYSLNRSVISNDEYDDLCKELASGWRTGEHQHKHLVTLADLRAVTGYAIKYPPMVIGGAMVLLQNHREV